MVWAQPCHQDLVNTLLTAAVLLLLTPGMWAGGCDDIIITSYKKSYDRWLPWQQYRSTVHECVGSRREVSDAEHQLERGYRVHLETAVLPTQQAPVGGCGWGRGLSLARARAGQVHLHAAPSEGGQIRSLV